MLPKVLIIATVLLTQCTNAHSLVNRFGATVDINDGLEVRFKLADRVVAKLDDIKAGLLNYYSAKMHWPTELSHIVSDNYYLGQFTTPYGNEIAGTALGDRYTLVFTAESDIIAKHIASQVNGAATSKAVTLTLGLPSQSAAVSSSLSRFYDATGVLNTMQTKLLMDNNDIVDVNDLSATTVNASSGIYDNGSRVYSAAFKPSAQDIGAVPNTTTINGHALSADVIITKADIGLGKVNNFAISDAYNLDSSTTYASSKAVKSAYDVLNQAKLSTTATAANAEKLDGIDSSGFARSSTTVNGHALSANIILTKMDIGLSNVANYAISDSYSDDNAAQYASSKAVNGLRQYVASHYVPTTRTINGKPLSNDIALSAADVGAISSSVASTVTANTTWHDNNAAHWGTGNDLTIYHDGNNSLIRNATNNLYLDNIANGHEIYLRTTNTAGTTHTAIGAMSDANVYAQLYYNSSAKMTTEDYGVKVAGTVLSSDWQTHYMKAFHGGNSFAMRPYDDSVWQSNREFGYDAANNRWFAETDLAVTGKVIAADVIAGGTSMSAIKTYMENNKATVVKTLYQGGREKAVILTEDLVVGASYYIETGGANGTQSCGSSRFSNPWFILTYTGTSQTHRVSGYCDDYSASETMTVSAANYLTTTSGGWYDVGFVKVIRVN